MSDEVLVFFSKNTDLGTEAECRFDLSFSHSTRNDQDPQIQPSMKMVIHTNTTTNGGRCYHSPFLFYFLFYFSIYLFSFVFFVLDMVETHCFLIFWFGLLIRFGCKKLMNVCKFGLLSKWV